MGTLQDELHLRDPMAERIEMALSCQVHTWEYVSVIRRHDVNSHFLKYAEESSKERSLFLYL